MKVDPPTKAALSFFDECVRGNAEFSLGFMKPNVGFPFGSVSSFGHPGAGGSLGFADPETQIGYAYVPNRLECEWPNVSFRSG